MDYALRWRNFHPLPAAESVLRCGEEIDSGDL